MEKNYKNTICPDCLDSIDAPSDTSYNDLSMFCRGCSKPWPWWIEFIIILIVIFVLLFVGSKL